MTNVFNITTHVDCMTFRFHAAICLDICFISIVPPDEFCNQIDNIRPLHCHVNELFYVYFCHLMPNGLSFSRRKNILVPKET